MKKLYEESKRINVPGENYGGKLGEPAYGNNAKLLMFIMFTGLRIDEAIDLKWKDLDLKQNTPRVNVTSTSIIVKDRDNISVKSIFPFPHQQNFGTNVPLNTQALEIITYEKKLNPAHSDTDYVFITKNGGKIQSRQNVNRTLKKMMSRANCSIPYCTPHELRHSLRSALLRNGVNIKVVSIFLEHKDITVTYNIHIHILEGLHC